MQAEVCSPLPTPTASHPTGSLTLCVLPSPHSLTISAISTAFTAGLAGELRHPQGNVCRFSHSRPASQDLSIVQTDIGIAKPTALNRDSITPARHQGKSFSSAAFALSLRRPPECALLCRLCLGLYGYKPATLDSDVQVVPFEQQHTHERSAARSVGLDMSRLAVPEIRIVVNVESHFSHCR